MEAEDDGVANVQVADFTTGGLEFPGLGDNIPNGVNEARNAGGNWDWSDRAGHNGRILL